MAGPPIIQTIAATAARPQVQFNMTDHMGIVTTAYLTLIADRIHLALAAPLLNGLASMPVLPGWPGQSWYLASVERGLPGLIHSLFPLLDLDSQMHAFNFIGFTVYATGNIEVTHFGPFDPCKNESLREEARKIRENYKKHIEEEEARRSAAAQNHNLAGMESWPALVDATKTSKRLLMAIETAKKEMKVLSKELMKLTATVVKTAEKEALKEGGETVAKKIPGVGLICGLGFAISRSFQGDHSGAVMELMSGTASLVPGLGTAISVGIDGALLAKDMYALYEGVEEMRKEVNRKAELVKELKKELKTNEENINELRRLLDIQIEDLKTGLNIINSIIDKMDQSDYLEMLHFPQYSLEHPETADQLIEHLKSFRQLTEFHRFDNTTASMLVNYIILPSMISDEATILECLAKAEFDMGKISASMLRIALDRAKHIPPFITFRIIDKKYNPVYRGVHDILPLTGSVQSIEGYVIWEDQQWGRTAARLMLVREEKDAVKRHKLPIATMKNHGPLEMSFSLSSESSNNSFWEAAKEGDKLALCYDVGGTGCTLHIKDLYVSVRCKIL